MAEWLVRAGGVSLVLLGSTFVSEQVSVSRTSTSPNFCRFFAPPPHRKILSMSRDYFFPNSTAVWLERASSGCPPSSTLVHLREARQKVYRSLRKTESAHLIGTLKTADKVQLVSDQVQRASPAARRRVSRFTGGQGGPLESPTFQNLHSYLLIIIPAKNSSGTSPDLGLEAFHRRAGRKGNANRKKSCGGAGAREL